MPSRSRALTRPPARGRCGPSIALAAVAAALVAGVAAPRVFAQAQAVRVSPPDAAGGSTVFQQQPAPGIRRAPSVPARQEAAVPPQYAPPGGMCRVWVSGVPPEQQPAPTQCAKAVRVRSPNSRVVFGPPRQVYGSTSEHTGVGLGTVTTEHPIMRGGSAATAGRLAETPHPPTASDPAPTTAGTQGQVKNPSRTPEHIPPATPHRSFSTPRISARSRH